jgi:hypothetical protein
MSNTNPIATASDIVSGNYYCDAHGVARVDTAPPDYGSPADLAARGESPEEYRRKRDALLAKMYGR